MSRLSTPVCSFGDKAPDFELKDADGATWSLEDCRGENGLLVMFICNHCPYVKAVRKKIVRDTTELSALGISSVAIMPNDTLSYPDDSLDNMKRVALQFAFPFPYLIDVSQSTARAYGAVCTPDFFGYNGTGPTVWITYSAGRSQPRVILAPPVSQPPSFRHSSNSFGPAAR